LLLQMAIEVDYYKMAELIQADILIAMHYIF